MKNRGEAVTTVLLIVAIGYFIVNAAPNLNPFRPLKESARPNTQTAKWDKVYERATPMYAIPQKDGIAVFNQVERGTSKGSESTTPRQTLWQKIVWFFADLGWGLVVIIVILTLIGVPIIQLIRERFMYKKALTNTVVAIDTMDDNAFKVLKPALEAEQDKGDKVVIDNIKTDLRKEGVR